MRIILFTGLIALLAFVTQSFFPWWTIVIPSAVLGLLAFRKGNEAFISSFAGLFLLWLIHALMQHTTSSGDMTERMAATFGLPLVVLLLVTGLVGGLVSGFAGLSGYYLQQLTHKKKR